MVAPEPRCVASLREMGMYNTVIHSHSSMKASYSYTSRFRCDHMKISCILYYVLCMYCVRIMYSVINITEMQMFFQMIFLSDSMSCIWKSLNFSQTL